MVHTWTRLLTCLEVGNFALLLLDSSGCSSFHRSYCYGRLAALHAWSVWYLLFSIYPNCNYLYPNSNLISVLIMTLKVTSWSIIFSVKNFVKKKIHQRFHDFFGAHLVNSKIQKQHTTCNDLIKISSSMYDTSHSKEVNPWGGISLCCSRLGPQFSRSFGLFL